MPQLPLRTGIRVHYELDGPQDAPVVVFVNGLLTDLHSWDGHQRAFEGYRRLRWDCRGQGLSSKPEQPSYSVATHAGDLVALLDALDLHQPVALVGLSNGAAAALCVASEHPARVSAMVLAGAYAQVDRALAVKLHSWLMAMEAGGSALRFDVATPWVWGAAFLEENYEMLKSYRDRGLALDEDAVERLVKGAVEHRLTTEALARIAAPALVMVGEDDLLTPPALARQIVHAVAGARLAVLPGLGHAAALEDVDGFARAARRFVDDNRGSGGD